MPAWLYSTLAHALRLAAWPALWWLGRKTPAFRERWAERAGRASVPPAARDGLLVHAASMGEVAAAAPLVEALLAARPDLPLLFSCTTPTASALIRQRFGTRVHHLYLPFDTPGAVRRFLAALAPRMLVLLETELWPNLLRIARAQGTLVVLVNGRLSERSARRYARFPALTRRLLAALDLLLVQDEPARQRFLALGAAPARTQVTGSLKFDAAPAAGDAALQAAFRRLAAGRTVWVGASTHEGEEAALLEVLPALRARWPALLLVLVPRHPQRFDAVAALIARQGLVHQRRSAGQPCRCDTDVMLGDSMGELTAWLAVADLVFMGGSLIERGGHNPLEAMQFGAPLVAGPHVFNFTEVFAALDAAQAVRTVHSAAELGAAVEALLAAPAAARALGERGRAVYQGRGGATARSLAPMLGLLDRLAAQTARRVPGGQVWADPAVFPQPGAALFDAAHWLAQRRALGQAQGRSTVWFLRHGALELVLRHYHRGGLVGRVLKDRYLREPLSRTRAMAEYALLRRLRAWGLPVPRPCAAALWRGWTHYRADIIVERITGCEDLSQRLQRAPVAAAEWRRVGAAIAQLHAAGVYHSDLNCHNLLLCDDPGQAPDADGRVWVVDFDKCEVRAPGEWQQANLDRLRRSLRKERDRLHRWHWAEASDWPALCAGYDAAMAAAAEPAEPAEEAEEAAASTTGVTGSDKVDARA